MKVDEKQQIVAVLQEKLSRSKIVVLTDYKGLDVLKINALRRKLREIDVEYRVVKNTLLVRASEACGLEALKDSCKGPNAIAFSYEDPVAPAKVLTEFARENDKLEIKVGMLDGKLLDVQDLKALAALPSREVLLAQLLGVLNAVPTSFVRVLNAVPGNLMNVLQAIKEQKENQEAA